MPDPWTVALFKIKVLLSYQEALCDCALRVRVQPAFEGAILFPQLANFLRIDDRGIDLQTVADDACIRQQTGTVLLREFGDIVNIKPAIGLAEVIGLLQDRDPRKPRLVDLKDQSFEEQVIITERETILGIVITPIESVFGM